MVSRRLRILTPSTFCDMGTLDIPNICLQKYRNNRRYKILLLYEHKHMERFSNLN